MKLSSFEIEGLKELTKQLSALGKAAGSKALRSATMFAMTPVVKEAKENVPTAKNAHFTHKRRLVAPGFAARSVIKRSILSRDKKTVWVSVGVKSEAYYAVNFIELGVPSRKIPKRPWLSRAMEKKQKVVTDRLGSQLKKKIKAAIKKR